MSGGHGALTGAALHPRRLHRILTLVANLLPLAGVFWWGWDVFEVLILFWMQTVLVALFALLHVHKLPASALGTIEKNGGSRPATRRDVLQMIAFIAVVFCGGQFMFLWFELSGTWSKLVHGPSGFWHSFVIANGAWMVLAANAIAELFGYLMLPPSPAFVVRIAASVGLEPDTPDLEVPDVMLLALIERIVLMQIALILGGLVADYTGSMAPLALLIAVKTYDELRGAPVAPRTASPRMQA